MNYMTKLTRTAALATSLATVACGGGRELDNRQTKVQVPGIYGNQTCSYEGTVNVKDNAPKFDVANLEFVVELERAENCDATIGPYKIHATFGAEGQTIPTLFATEFKGGEMDYGSWFDFDGCDSGNYRSFLNKNGMLRVIPEYTPVLNQVCTSDQRALLEGIGREAIQNSTPKPRE